MFNDDCLPRNSIKCLDKGYVQLIDWMGSDASIVEAARTSTQTGSQEMESKDLSDKDKILLRYLLRHRHTTPFEMVEFKFNVKAPIFVARQWFRHRTASYNEMSGRYTQLPDEFYVPDDDKITFQSKANMQGRTDQPMSPEDGWRDLFIEEQARNYEVYQTRIDGGMSKELARINMPVSVYTQFYFKQNLWNLMHFLHLRMDSHAQYEIRVYAKALYDLAFSVAPLAMVAFDDYIRNAVTLTATEIKVLPWMLRHYCSDALFGLEDTHPLYKELAEAGMTKREIEEFRLKLKMIEEGE